MSTSLKDQLLGLGFSAPKPEPRQPKPIQSARPAHRDPAAARGARKGEPRKPQSNLPGKPPTKQSAKQPGKQRSREDIDLAKAYAIRAQREKDERIEAERLKQEEARMRREAKAALASFLAGKGLNMADAEHVRHFEYGGKIKRIHVSADQLKALNAGALGVVQQDGRYLLVDTETLAQAEAIFAPAVALKVDPHAPAEQDPYADPRYQVPDDLIW
jgi:uncharacterized protein YaiL (DUF2058 family)